jgi:hypothetical protein
MIIPDEAVEAAYGAINYPDQQAIDRDEIQIILKAALPFIQAQALRDAVGAFPLETITAPDNAVAWLMRRADEIEGRA